MFKPRMFHLVKKDLKLTVQQSWIPITALWLFLLVNSRSKGFPFMMISILLVFQPLLVDDKNKMENVFASLPVSRTDIVIARYVAGLLLMVFTICATYLGALLVHGVFPDLLKKSIPISNILGAQVPVMFFMAMIYPIFFKFGAYLDAGMKVVAIVLSGSIFLAFAVMFLLNHFNIDLFSIDYILLYTLVLALVLIFLSLLLSRRIYRRREF